MIHLADDAMTETPIAPAPIPTWFGVGGGAERFARPQTAAQLARLLRDNPGMRILGDGANLLVDDDGVPELVVSLKQGEFAAVDWSADGLVRAGAGADLPRLVTESVRRGLRGLEGLGGVPASVGGAAIMNAGGAFGPDCRMSSAACTPCGATARPSHWSGLRFPSPTAAAGSRA